MTLIHELEPGHEVSAMEREARAEDELARDDFAAAEARLEGAAAASHASLAANAEARARLRRQADKTELRLAFRDLAEGVRGMIRSAPLTAVLVGVAAGMALSRRRQRRPTRLAAPRR